MTFCINDQAFCLTPRIYLTSAASTSTLRQKLQSTVLLTNTCCDSLGRTKAPPWRGQSALPNTTFLWGAHLDTLDCMAVQRCNAPWDSGTP